jgi:hypothetical protein
MMKKIVILLGCLLANLLVFAETNNYLGDSWLMLSFSYILDDYTNMPNGTRQKEPTAICGAWANYTFKDDFTFEEREVDRDGNIKGKKISFDEYTISKTSNGIEIISFSGSKYFSFFVSSELIILFTPDNDDKTKSYFLVRGQMQKDIVSRWVNQG